MSCCFGILKCCRTTQVSPPTVNNSNIEIHSEKKITAPSTNNEFTGANPVIVQPTETRPTPINNGGMRNYLKRRLIQSTIRINVQPQRLTRPTSRIYPFGALGRDYYTVQNRISEGSDDEIQKVPPPSPVSTSDKSTKSSLRYQITDNDLRAHDQTDVKGCHSSMTLDSVEEIPLDAVDHSVDKRHSLANQRATVIAWANVVPPNSMKDIEEPSGTVSEFLKDSNKSSISSQQLCLLSQDTTSTGPELSAQNIAILGEKVDKEQVETASWRNIPKLFRRRHDRPLAAPPRRTCRPKRASGPRFGQGRSSRVAPSSLKPEVVPKGPHFLTTVWIRPDSSRLKKRVSTPLIIEDLEDEDHHELMNREHDQQSDGN